MSNSTNKQNVNEYEYLNLIRNVINDGICEESRNGKTKEIFGYTMRFSLKDSVLPLITTKKFAWKTCLKELLWFIKGKMDVRLLQKENVKIWDLNTTREFLDSVGLTSYPEGIPGPIYGHQWRNFNGEYFLDVNSDNLDNPNVNVVNFDNENNETNEKYDQLQEIIDCLKDPAKRNSRRLIMSAWNPCQLKQMCLPPCHVLCQFRVLNGNELSCILFQRSGDIGLGVPFNIASYAFLTILLAHHCDLIPSEFIHTIGSAHIYEDHIEPLMQQIERKPFSQPTVQIKVKRDNIDDYVIDDFEVSDYETHPPISMKMSA